MSNVIVAIRCSFCGKRPDEVTYMVQADKACICNACIQDAQYSINERVREQEEKLKRDLPIKLKDNRKGKG